MTRRPLFWVLLASCYLTACSHSLTMHARDGEQLLGRYRHSREGRGLMQVARPDGEILFGTFFKIDRTTFVNGYEKAFGRGSIEWDGPDLSAAGSAFSGLLGISYATGESASGQQFNAPPGKTATVVSGPLFYWTAFLESDRRTSMRCYLIGSIYTGNGFGRCVNHQGMEYSVEF